MLSEYWWNDKDRKNEDEDKERVGVSDGNVFRKTCTLKLTYNV